MLMTMSSSVAPSFSAVDAVATFTSGAWPPWGNPMTVEVFTPVSFNRRAVTGT